jgi:hypothetical protein
MPKLRLFKKKIDIIGFIILRYVTNEKINLYWIKCYDSIRKYYPHNPILIIDDNSDYKYITSKNLYNTTVIKSEYPRRGELLPYYYYLKNKLFDIAVIIHDSVFINKYIDFSVDNFKIIWDFSHNWDQPDDELKMIKLFNDQQLINFYNNKTLWRGCFGGMSIIKHSYLSHINDKYNISLLLDVVLNRYNRMSFERIIAVLLQINSKSKNTILLGDITKYCKWGLDFKNKEKNNNLPIIKVWTGR